MVVINSPDGIKAFTELSAGKGTAFHTRGRAGRSIRGIPDKEVHRVRITMSDEMNVQEVNDNGFISGIMCPKVFMAAGMARMSPADFTGVRTPQTIRIRGCQAGYFP
jgi:hypothetical protein